MQLSGRLDEEDVDRIADRVLMKLHEAAREATGGESESRHGAHAADEDHYERPEEGQ